ncbi:MAG: NAD(P)/FAD-dependent oxidoreductase [Lachnospiraceae bacterium]|nr:NAD(P)/FAD-dependent oxidoreductase [Lachnospiraceae bacterium]
MFDVIVIGGGPGGYKTANLLGLRGYNVAMVEKDYVGGICLNRGCIPFKTYLHTSEIISEANKYIKAKILNGQDISINQKNLLDQKNIIVDGLRRGITNGLNACGVKLYEGEALYSGRAGDNYLISVNGELIEGKKIVIATGAKDVEMASIKINGNMKIITSSEMLELSEVPKRITIVGAGAIGLEAAAYFNEVGSEVSLVEYREHIGGGIDSDIADALARIINKKGIDLYVSSTVEEVDDNNVYVKCADGSRINIDSECVLLAVGRKPNIDEKMLADLNISYDDNGIKINDKCQTCDENVFACGDVTGQLMLAHTAYRQAKVIADTIDGKGCSIDYRYIPKVIYMHPESLSVGLTEQECIENGMKYDTRSLPMTYSGKYFADHGKDGAKVKMIIDEHRRIIGFHMLANDSSEISLAAELMIANGMSIDDICNLVYAHPSYSEIIGDVAELFNR